MGEIRIGVIGATGKMGREICKTIIKEPGMRLVAAVSEAAYDDIGPLLGLEAQGVPVSTDLAATLDACAVDVMVDFTNASAVMQNAPVVINKKVRLVSGTTGLSDDEKSIIRQLAERNAVGVFFASNFAIGAVLMMKFAEEAARFLPHVEVIEMHHDQKLDAPSGTAVTTLERMAKVRPPFEQGADGEWEKIPGSRGGNYQGMHVHSVRLPGYVASQEVIFGGLGQTLHIRHETISRESFMPGVLLAIKQVMTWVGLVEDLETIMQ